MKLDKTKLDELIEMVRKMWTDLKPELVEERAKEMYKLKDEHFPMKANIVEFLHSILSVFGMKHDAANEDIYKVLEVLGYEVTE